MGLLKKKVVIYSAILLKALCCAVSSFPLIFYTPILSTHVFSVPYPASSKCSGHVYIPLKGDFIYTPPNPTIGYFSHQVLPIDSYILSWESGN